MASLDHFWPRGAQSQFGGAGPRSDPGMLASANAVKHSVLSFEAIGNRGFYSVLGFLGIGNRGFLNVLGFLAVGNQGFYNVSGFLAIGNRGFYSVLGFLAIGNWGFYNVSGLLAIGNQTFYSVLACHPWAQRVKTRVSENCLFLHRTIIYDKMRVLRPNTPFYDRSICAKISILPETYVQT